jgi:hypothetical protein
VGVPLPTKSRWPPEVNSIKTASHGKAHAMCFELFDKQGDTMLFDPNTHTKNELLTNPALAFEIAEKSAQFAKHALAQDVDILGLACPQIGLLAFILIEAQPEWINSEATQRVDVLELIDETFGWSVAHELASKKSSRWSMTEAAQNLRVLSLKTNEGLPVAHIIADKCPEWSKTMAAQRYEVLCLASNTGATVAHRLSMHQAQWAETEAAQQTNVLSLFDDWGVSVAHYLSMQPAWIETKAAEHKSVLTLCSESNGSVAQKMLCIYPKKAQMLTKFLTIGLAYKTTASSKSLSWPRLSLSDIEEFVQHAQDLITGSSEPVTRLKIIITLYSTLQNIKFDVGHEKSNKGSEILNFIHDVCTSLENTLRKLHASEPSQFENKHRFFDVNCEPAIAFLNRMVPDMNQKIRFNNEPPAELCLQTQYRSA